MQKNYKEGRGNDSGYYDEEIGIKDILKILAPFWIICLVMLVIVVLLG